MGGGLQRLRAELSPQVGNMKLLLCQLEDVEAEIAKVEDVTETEFAALERDAKSIIEASIDAVRDLEETDFAAEPRDAEAALTDFIAKVRDLEPSEFSMIFD